MYGDGWKGIDVVHHRLLRSRMPRIIAGPFAGNEGELIADLGDTLELCITLFGRDANVRVRRADLEFDSDTPEEELARLLERIRQDQRSLVAREQGEFWRSLVDEPPAPALVEHSEYLAHCTEVEARGAAREQALLAEFGRLGAGLGATQLRALLDANRARWLVEGSGVRADTHTRLRPAPDSGGDHTLRDRGSCRAGGGAERARRHLAAGDPSEALCLGRDLHWLSLGVEAREALACELLSAAYRALGRESLAGIVEAHRRHRNQTSVDVLLRR